MAGLGGRVDKKLEKEESKTVGGEGFGRVGSDCNAKDDNVDRETGRGLGGRPSDKGESKYKMQRRLLRNC